MESAPLQEGDLLLIVADRPKAVFASLAALRAATAREQNLVDEGKHAFCWVTDFPLLERDEATRQWSPMNHPFTAPRSEDLALLEEHPEQVLARAYDVVLNGSELGSGSIRIHRADIQERVFRVLGISEEEGRERFGFLLDALRYGAPPHGGIGLGLDRICALAAGTTSIRDVIAFPKTTSGLDLMTKSPSPVAAAPLADLGITLSVPPLPPGEGRG
jgi:aspartyl-tRNA synthetase